LLDPVGPPSATNVSGCGAPLVFPAGEDTEPSDEREQPATSSPAANSVEASLIIDLPLIVDLPSCR
jgi:hypothetical protein